MLNQKYSLKSFRNQKFTDVPASEFNNTTIKGSSFYQSCCRTDGQMVNVFPPGMTGVTFEDCNLDNVIIPPGNTVVRGTNKRLKLQNDLMDWECDKETGAPIKPANGRLCSKVGVSQDPKDLPRNRIDEPIVVMTQEARDGIIR